MYLRNYSSVPLNEVLNALIPYMDAESAQKMVCDCKTPSAGFLSYCDRAYELYERAMEHTLEKGVVW